ncbi:hypothetical protein SORBI_3010G020900 [Sorghum bicolor]|uniref:F-box domain-containing protein n=1 Tax=Sorghum bicolor TaxID=4558 RepID=A0A1W0VR64_SORBI|nr:hypothetical protein SORBI_3010G020900 [Sorghum bicolor]
MARTPDPWSNIPLELAGLVLKRLPAHVDRVRFAAVCPQWRSAARQVRLPPPLPLLALKDGDILYSMPRGEPLHFAGYKNGHLSGCRNGFYTACGNWLVYRRLDDLLLLDPFSGATMTLPPPSSFVDTDVRSEKLFMDVRYSQVIKLMVCSPNLIAALFQVARDLSLWITDMAFYQGKLYVVDYHEDLLALDISVDGNTGDPWVSRIGRVIDVGHFDDQRTLLRMLYLVESCGSLLLVCRRIFHMHAHDDGQIHTFAGQCEPYLSIFEADFARSRWSKVTTLADNQALFLGPCSRAICMPQSDSQGNRVWFLDDYKDFHLWSEWRSRSLSSGTCSVANPKPFSPLPMISWKGYLGNAGAAWIFPAN